MVRLVLGTGVGCDQTHVGGMLMEMWELERDTEAKHSTHHLCRHRPPLTAKNRQNPFFQLFVEDSVCIVSYHVCVEGLNKFLQTSKLTLYSRVFSVDLGRGQAILCFA